MSSQLDTTGSIGEFHFGNPEIKAPKKWRYECELSPIHQEGVLFLPKIHSGYPEQRFESWSKYLEGHEDPLGYVASWIESAINQLPAGVDVARDVDGGGYTQTDKVEPCMFTRWVELGHDPIVHGPYIRFARARTAMHHSMFTTHGLSQGGALRSPVMGGVCLEVTSDPVSLDPRDAVTLAIFGFAKEQDARYPWVHARPGQLYDMTEFTEKPYNVGPLYDGHPNKVTDQESIEVAMKAAVTVLDLIYHPDTSQSIPD